MDAQHADTLICSLLGRFSFFSLCTVFVTKNCKTSGTPEFVRFEFVRKQFVFLFIYFCFVFQLQSRMLEVRVWNLEATRKQGGYVCEIGRDVCWFFQLLFQGSKVSQTGRSALRFF